MAITTVQFKPASGIKALFDQIYEIKFSKHVPLFVVLLSMVYTIYRTQHYLGSAFQLDPIVRWPTSIFIELLVLGSSAAVFIALRAAFIAQLKDEDADLARYGVWLSFVALGASFVALLTMAGADAFLLTQEFLPSLMMTLIQATQMLFICGFIINATIDERGKLRTSYTEYAQSSAQQQANQCPYCFKPVAANNRKRHLASCPNRPAQP